MNEQKNDGENLRVVVDPDKCELSGECMKICPRGAISVRGDKAVIDPENCDLDGICIAACPKGAIHFINQ